MKVSTMALLYLFLLSTAEGAHDARMKKHAQSLAQSMETDKKAKGGPGTDRRIFVLDEELLSCTVDDNCDEYGTEDTLKCEGTEGKEGLWCHCLDSHIFNKVTKRCQAVTPRDIDTPCPQDEECGEGHICEDNECRCLKGTFFNKDNKQCQASDCPRNTFVDCNDNDDQDQDCTLIGANCVENGNTGTKYCFCEADECYANWVCQKDLPINWCHDGDVYYHVSNMNSNADDYTDSPFYKEGEKEYWVPGDKLWVWPPEAQSAVEAEVVGFFHNYYHHERWEQIQVKYVTETATGDFTEKRGWIKKCTEACSLKNKGPHNNCVRFETNGFEDPKPEAQSEEDLE